MRGPLNARRLHHGYQEDLQPNEAINKRRLNLPPTLVATSAPRRNQNKVWSHQKGRRGSWRTSGGQSAKRRIPHEPLFSSGDGHVFSMTDREKKNPLWNEFRSNSSRSSSIIRQSASGYDRPFANSDSSHLATSQLRKAALPAFQQVPDRPTRRNSDPVSNVPPSPSHPKALLPARRISPTNPPRPQKRQRVVRELLVSAKEERTLESSLQLPSSMVHLHDVSKLEDQSSILPSRRLVSFSCNRYLLPDFCHKTNPNYYIHRKKFADKEVGILRKKGLKINKVFFRDDGMVIEWTSSIPVWSDTYLPEKNENIPPRATPECIDLVSDDESEKSGQTIGTITKKSGASAATLLPSISTNEAPCFRIRDLLRPTDLTPAKCRSLEPGEKNQKTRKTNRKIPSSSSQGLALLSPIPSTQTFLSLGGTLLPSTQGTLDRTVPEGGFSTERDEIPVFTSSATSISPRLPLQKRTLAGPVSFNNSRPKPDALALEHLLSDASSYKSPSVAGKSLVEVPNIMFGKVWSAEELQEVEPLAAEFLQRYMHCFDTSTESLTDAYASFASFSHRTLFNRPHIRPKTSVSAFGCVNITRALRALSSLKYCPPSTEECRVRPRNLHYDVVSLGRAAGGGIFLTTYGEVAKMPFENESRDIFLVNQSFVLQKPEDGRSQAYPAANNWSLTIISHHMVLQLKDAHDHDRTWINPNDIETVFPWCC